MLRHVERFIAQSRNWARAESLKDCQQHMGTAILRIQTKLEYEQGTRAKKSQEMCNAIAFLLMG